PACRGAPDAGDGNGRRRAEVRAETQAVPRRPPDRDPGSRLRIDGDAVMTPRKIDASAIVPLPQYAGERAERRKRMAELKKNRRLEGGPVATFYFESDDTMLHQAHGMLFTDKGGYAQVHEELATDT